MARATLRAEVTINNPKSKAIFSKWSSDRTAIEGELGEPVVWYDSQGKRVCRILVKRPANIRSRADWQEQHKWLTEKLEALHRVFSKRAKEIDAKDLCSE